MLLLAGCADLIVTVSFDSFAEAEETGYMERRWIPDYIPATAGRIEEAHDLDTNQSCGMVQHNPEDLETLMEVLPAERYASHTEELPALPGFGLLHSCPFSLAEFSDENQVIRGMEMFRIGGGDSAWIHFVVLDEERGCLYYWIGLKADQ